MKLPYDVYFNFILVSVMLAVFRGCMCQAALGQSSIAARASHARANIARGLLGQNKNCSYFYDWTSACVFSNPMTVKPNQNERHLERFRSKYPLRHDVNNRQCVPGNKSTL